MIAAQLVQAHRGQMVVWNKRRYLIKDIQHVGNSHVRVVVGNGLTISYAPSDEVTVEP